MGTVARVAGAILVGLLAVILALMALLHTDWARERASAYASEQLGRQVSAADHSIAWSLQPRLRLEQVRIANADWASEPVMAHVPALELKLDLASLVWGRTRLPSVALYEPQLHLEQAADGRRNWDFLTRDEPQADAGPGVRVDRWRVRDGRLSYADPARDTALQLAVSAELSEGQGRLHGHGEGQLAAAPFGFEVTGTSGDAALPAGAVGLQGLLRVGEHEATVAGRIRDPLELDGVLLAVTAVGPDPQPLAAAFDQQLPPLGDYALSAELRRDGHLLAVRELAGHIGSSQLSGELQLQTTKRPAAQVALTVETLNLEPLELGDGGEPAAADTPLAQRLHQALAPLRQFDAEVELRVGELRARGVVAQQVQALASLEQGHLDLRRLRADFADGSLSLGGELQIGEGMTHGLLRAEAESLDLGVVLQEWDVFAAGVVDGHLELNLDPQLLTVTEAVLDYRDPARELALQLEAHTLRLPDSGNRSRLWVQGERAGQPFTAEALGGPLLRLEAPAAPDPLDIRFATGETRIEIQGQLDRLLEEGAVEARFAATGEDLDGLGILLGIDLPAVPPYQMQAHLLGQGYRWQLRDLQGNFGNSDLAGDLELLLEPGAPPFVRAALRSEHLNVDDLRMETAEEQEQSLSELLQAIDGELEFSGEQVRTERIPMQRVRLRAALDGARLELRPLEFDLGGGALSFNGYLDADQVPMRGALDARAKNVDLSDILPALGIAADSGGLISSRAKIEVAGHTFGDWIQTAVGELHLLMTGGRVDSLLVELAGEENAEQMRDVLLPEEDAVLTLDCAYLGSRADSGLVEIDNFFVTTPNINVLGQGAIDVRERTFDLTIGSETEDLSLLELLSPVELQGSWDDPEVNIITADLIARGVLATLAAVLVPGVGGVLGAATPLLAGLGDDPTPCHEIIEQAEAEVEGE